MPDVKSFINGSHLIANAYREISRDGKSFYVVPGVPMREQVMNTYLVPAEEIQGSLLGWNDTPISIGHPQQNNGSVQVPDPDVPIIGVFSGARWDPDKKRMTGEYWIDVNEAEKWEEGKQILEAVRNGKILETSTGYYAAEEMTPGEFGGRQYMTIHRNLIRDHIAILPRLVGACSVRDGCGVNVNQAKVFQNCECDCPFKSETVTNARVPDYVEGHLPRVMLEGYAFNKGSRTPEQIENLRAIIKEKGIPKPVFVMRQDDGNLKIIDGNHRVAIAGEPGIDIEQIPVRCFDPDLRPMDCQVIYTEWAHKQDQSYLNSFPDHEGRPGERGGSMPRGAGAAIKDHPNFDQSDYDYLKEKGYTDPEILKIWDDSRGPQSHGPIPDVVGTAMGKPSPTTTEKQYSPDPEIKALQLILEDTSLSRPERVKASEDMRTLFDANNKKYSDGRSIASVIDDLIASGSNKIKTSGPRAWLVNKDNGDQWNITTKLERDYADYRLRAKQNRDSQAGASEPDNLNFEKESDMSFKLPDLLTFLRGKGMKVTANESGEFEVEETTPAGPAQNATNIPILNADEVQALRDLASLVPVIERMQTFMNAQAASTKAERDTLIATIKANASNTLTDDELSGMPTPALEKLNGMMNVNYGPLGGGETFVNSDEVLTLPSALTSFSVKE